MAQLNINALAEMMSQTANKSIGGVARGIKQQRANTAATESNTATQQFALEQAKKEREMKAAEDEINQRKRAALSPYLRIQPLMDGRLADINGDGVVSDEELAAASTQILQADLNRPGMTAEEKMATEKLLQSIQYGVQSGDYGEFRKKVGIAQPAIDQLAISMKDLEPYTSAAMRERMEQRRKQQATDISGRAVAVQEAQLNKPGPGFTLGEGQERYDAQGNLIAQNQQAAAQPFGVGGDSQQSPIAQPQASESILPPALEGQDVIGLATGAQSTVSAALEGFSPTADLASGELNVQAKQVLSGIAKQLESAYVNNPRVPVSEREQMKELGLTNVQGGFWQSASGIRERLTAATPMMERRLMEELRLANDPAATTKVRGEAQLSAQQLYSALTNMRAVLSSGQADAEEQSLLDKYAPRGQ